VNHSNIEYVVARRQRTTVEIAVHPDGSVEVAAPLDLAEERIAQFIEKHSDWIRRKQTFFHDFDPRPSPRRYVAGETQLYLGRNYRLRLHKGVAEVSLSNGYLVVTSAEATPTEIARIVEAWRRRQARFLFSEILDQVWNAMPLGSRPRPRLCIKALRRRWGSLSENGMLTLNLSLIQAPRACIEYVVVHELCHIDHPGHGQDFYAALKDMLPDWKERKHRLERLLG